MGIGVVDAATERVILSMLLLSLVITCSNPCKNRKKNVKAI